MGTKQSELTDVYKRQVFVLSILYHIPLPVSCIKCEETPYFQAFTGFSSMSLRMSFFIFLSSVSVARSLADEHTR